MQLIKDKRLITIRGKRFKADIKLIPLLKELNKIGLKTTHHCCGHNKKRAYVSILLEDNVEVHINDSRLSLSWLKDVQDIE